MLETDPFLAALVDAVRKLPPEYLLEMLRSALVGEANEPQTVEPRATRPRKAPAKAPRRAPAPPAKAVPRAPVAKRKQPAPAKRRAASASAAAPKPEAVTARTTAVAESAPSAPEASELVAALRETIPGGPAENSNGRRWVKYRRPAKTGVGATSERFVVPEA